MTEFHREAIAQEKPGPPDIVANARGQQCRVGWRRARCLFALLVVGLGTLTIAASLAGGEAASVGPHRVMLPMVTAGESLGQGPGQFRWFPPRNDASLQVDTCGRFLIARQRQTNPPLFEYVGAPDDVIVYLPTAPEVVGFIAGPGRVSPFGNLFVDWCFDLESDGIPELAVSYWAGDTGPATLTVYSLGVTPERALTVRWTFESERVLGTMPINVDGALPFELIGADGRFQLLATSRPAGPVPPFVVRLDETGARTVPEYRWVFDGYRNEQFQRLAGCKEDAQCEHGALLGIMVVSLTLGDWDTVRLNPAIPAQRLREIEQCRDEVASAVANINLPFRGGFLGCFRGAQP